MDDTTTVSTDEATLSARVTEAYKSLVQRFCETNANPADGLAERIRLEANAQLQSGLKVLEQVIDRSESIPSAYMRQQQQVEQWIESGTLGFELLGVSSELEHVSTRLTEDLVAQQTKATAFPGPLVEIARGLLSLAQLSVELMEEDESNEQRGCDVIVVAIHHVRHTILNLAGGCAIIAINPANN